MSIRIQPDNQ